MQSTSLESSGATAMFQQPSSRYGGSRRRRRSPDARKGVVLLVILGLLSLFMLVVVSYVMTASAERHGAVINARSEQEPEAPSSMGNVVFNSMLQVVRGSQSPNSVVGPHSLLEDMYGDRESVSGAVFVVDPLLTLPTGGTSTISGLSNNQLVEMTGLSFGPDRQPGSAGVEDAGAAPAKPATAPAGWAWPKNSTHIIDDVGEYTDSSTSKSSSSSDDSPLDKSLPSQLDPRHNSSAVAPPAFGTYYPAHGRVLCRLRVDDAERQRGWAIDAHRALVQRGAQRLGGESCRRDA